MGDHARVPPIPREREERSLEGEEVAVTLALREGLIGLQVVDRWGTLRPEELLYDISQAHRRGVLPGEGRLGLYTIWRMSDDFQVRVHPGQKSASLALWSQEEGQAAGRGPPRGSPPSAGDSWRCSTRAMSSWPPLRCRRRSGGSSGSSSSRWLEIEGWAPVAQEELQMLLSAYRRSLEG